MYRWMISPIIGNGTENNGYRAAVSDVQGIDSAAIIPTFDSGPNVGKPKFLFTLCLVATPDVARIASVTNAYVFPDYNLDGRMDGMESSARTGLQQSVEAYNLDGNALHLDADHNDGDSYRSLIAAIGLQFDAAFNINTITVREPLA